MKIAKKYLIRRKYTFSKPYLIILLFFLLLTPAVATDPLKDLLSIDSETGMPKYVSPEYHPGAVLDINVIRGLIVYVVSENFSKFQSLGIPKEIEQSLPFYFDLYFPEVWPQVNISHFDIGLYSSFTRLGDWTIHQDYDKKVAYVEFATYKYPNRNQIEKYSLVIYPDAKLDDFKKAKWEIQKRSYIDKKFFRKSSMVTFIDGNAARHYPYEKPELNYQYSNKGYFYRLIKEQPKG